MAKYRVEQRFERGDESIVVEGTLTHESDNIEIIRRLIVEGEITPADVEWDAEVIGKQSVHGSFNVIVYG